MLNINESSKAVFSMPVIEQLFNFPWVGVEAKSENIIKWIDLHIKANIAGKILRANILNDNRAAISMVNEYVKRRLEMDDKQFELKRSGVKQIVIVHENVETVVYSI